MPLRKKKKGNKNPPPPTEIAPKKSDTSTVTVGRRISGSRRKFIIPTVVQDDGVDEPTEDEAEDEESQFNVDDEDDKTQHYFSDQLRFKRGKWNKPWFAMVSMVVAAIDISSVSSFPAKVANNGGMAFFIAYFISHGVLVLPYLYMESVIGQYFQISMVGVWGICPLFKGISVCTFVISFLFGTFCPPAMTWSSYMMAEAARSIQNADVRWGTCDNEWNSCSCDGRRNPECPVILLTGNQTLNSAAKEYFFGFVLTLWKSHYADPLVIKSVLGNGNASLSFGLTSPDGIGPFIVPSGLIISGMFLIILMVSGSSFTITGWLFTFSTTFPIVVLVLLICRGVILEGATDGLVKYFYPHWDKLADIQMWITASQGAFTAMSAGIGLSMAAASFNPLHHNVFRDVVGLIAIDSATRVLGCIAMFSFVGHQYARKNLELPDEYNGPFYMKLPT